MQKLKITQKLKQFKMYIKKSVYEIMKKDRFLTLLIIPHASRRKVKTIKLSPLRICLILFMNIMLISGICILSISIHNVGQKLETSYQDYKNLKNERDEYKKELNEYKSRDHEIGEKIKILEDLDAKLKDIIQSKSAEPQSSIKASNPVLSSRGAAFPNSFVRIKRISSDTESAESFNGPEGISNYVDVLADDIKSDIKQYDDISKSEEIKRKAELAIPSSLPVKGIITSKFGYRKSPFKSGYEFHGALDIAGLKGTPIKAAGEGVVIFSGRDTGGYGLMIKIDHKNGYVSAYGHNSKLIVASGEQVKRGQIIAYMGSTGKSTGTHCHFEVRLNGRPVNPLTIK